ncbi:unnamed protein product, partial [Allacma fusca]
MTNDFLPGFWPMMVDCPSLKTRLMESEERLKEIKHSSLSLAQYYRMSLLGKEVVDMMAILDALPGLFDMAVLTTGCLNRI